ncbi:MAG TPA: BtpA/SgcQ family protein [Thermoanaerobaculia bacterium]|nr:BtpA/SgcQ family protein [Thermoanaerobaculia bacterium]
MLDRNTFTERFGRRPIFGMVHLLPLPGAPLYGGSLDAVVDAAIADARAIEEGGAGGVIIENFGDRPFFASHVPQETMAAMTRVVGEITRAVKKPFGVNVLRNDAHAALAIAAATGAAFIRINVHTGAMLTDQGVIEGAAAETLRLRRTLAPGVAIFADHLVKHAAPLAAVDPIQMAKDLRLRGLADAVIVTGAETGGAADPSRLRMLREAIDAPLIIGSGLTPENAPSFREADGAIVGTSLERNGRVDAKLVAAVVSAFH